MRIDEFGSNPIEESLRAYIGPASGERERESGPQAAQTSHPVVIDQDIPLEESERTMPKDRRR